MRRIGPALFAFVLILSGCNVAARVLFSGVGKAGVKAAGSVGAKAAGSVGAKAVGAGVATHGAIEAAELVGARGLKVGAGAADDVARSAAVGAGEEAAAKVTAKSESKLAEDVADVTLDTAGNLVGQEDSDE